MSEQLFMLDTNTVSYLLRNQDRAIKKRLQQEGIGSVCISAITEAELRFGLRQNPANNRLGELVNSFISRVDSLVWDSEAARSYAVVRTLAKARGFTLSNMDMLIGAHAIAVGSTLITNDTAFSHLSEWITVDNWIT